MHAFHMYLYVCTFLSNALACPHKPKGSMDLKIKYEISVCKSDNNNYYYCHCVLCNIAIQNGDNTNLFLTLTPT